MLADPIEPIPDADRFVEGSADKIRTVGNDIRERDGRGMSTAVEDYGGALAKRWQWRDYWRAVVVDFGRLLNGLVRRWNIVVRRIVRRLGLRCDLVWCLLIDFWRC